LFVIPDLNQPVLFGQNWPALVPFLAHIFTLPDGHLTNSPLHILFFIRVKNINKASPIARTDAITNPNKILFDIFFYIYIYKNKILFVYFILKISFEPKT
jgi:hypothetical protein